MAVIAATSLKNAGARAVVTTVLDGSSDTFEYNKAASPMLILHNPTGSTISPVISGADATTTSAPGVGVIDVSAGYPVGAIAAGDTQLIPLNSVEKYLEGAIDIASGTGLEAQLLEH